MPRVLPFNAEHVSIGSIGLSVINSDSRDVGGCDGSHDGSSLSTRKWVEMIPCTSQQIYTPQSL